MKFRNPANGHIEEKHAAWLFVLLFGGLYFIASGLWTHVVIWLVLSGLLFASLGPAGVVPVLILQFVYALLASSLVRSAYLRRGWVELTEGGEQAAPTQGYRKCPYCAEEIRTEAIKCKHCGSTVEPPEAEGPAPVPPGGPISPTPPRGMPPTEYMQVVMAEHGITRAGEEYVWNGESHPSFVAVVQAINATRVS